METPFQYINVLKKWQGRYDDIKINPINQFITDYYSMWYSYWTPGAQRGDSSYHAKRFVEFFDYDYVHNIPRYDKRQKNTEGNFLILN